MTVLTCERVQDLLPDVADGSLDAALERHLAGCPECRAEAALLRRLRAATPPVPMPLESRVLRAVRIRPLRRTWAGPRPLAIAATLSAALIGGVLIVERLANGPDSPAFPGPQPDDPTTGAFLPVLEDPAVSGASVLPHLTEDELESLLSSMES